MTITQYDLDNYIATLRDVNQTAADKIIAYIDKYGLSDTKALIDYSYAIVSTYAEAAGAWAAEMYDAIGLLEGKYLPPAEIAEIAKYGDVAKAINGTLKVSENADEIAGAATRWVKMASADTMLNNALRDGAQFAWVPHGDTCAFCLTLASRGWQYASKKAIKGGHAEHIHSNCDCQYVIRFDEHTNVEGYDPDRYLSMYRNAEGRTPQERINSMRRASLGQHKDGDKVNITDQAIDKVKPIGSSSSTNDELELIQNMNREILRVSREQNDNNEVAMAIFDGHISSPVLGDLNSVGLYANSEMYHILKGTGTMRTVILSHNHPGLSYFSLDDIGVFVENPSIKTIEIVTNAGQTWYLSKKDNYDDAIAMDMYFQSMKDNIDDSSKAVEDFIKRMYHMIEKN